MYDVNNIPSTEIAEKYNCSPDTILRILRAEGVEIKKHTDFKFYKGYRIDDDAFSDIHDEQCAYFYGWILTDGCLRNKSVSLELCSKDEEVLVNLKNYLNSSNNIRYRSRVDTRTGNTYHQCSFSFSHEIILNRLLSLGLTHKKSLQEKCPDDFRLNRHFWRGVIEGDGHVSSTSDRVELCGGLELVTAFADYCRTIYPDCSPMFRKNGKMDIVRIYRKAACKVILDNLYSDCSVKLTRKYNAYKGRYYGS